MSDIVGHRHRWFAGCAVGALLLTAASAAAADDIDFARDIEPLLANNCYDCHSIDEAESDLRLDSVRLAIEGGNTGPAIVPGNSAESMLIERITSEDEDERMPPVDVGDRLSDDQIALLRSWIDAGAHSPESEAGTEQRLASDHWSFQPIQRPEMPPVSNLDWCRTPIDFYVLQRLEAEGLAPSPEADRTTLLRRLSLDLIGLPPTSEETAAFLADSREDAYERLVDRLLASPHYGERWGRHWLDQARYADSDGYTNDIPRSIWLYRDWVIDAMNRNLPFDEFIIDQIAGDQRPGATPQQIVATGFHRNTQHNREGGIDAEQYRVERIVDRASTTSTVLLGLTLGCARCHDHKFDPISQREFYQFYAFFNTSDEPKLETFSAMDLDAEGAPHEGAAPHSTLVLREQSQPRETHIHIRGDFLSPGREVSPATPSVLNPLPPETTSPTRLDLAHWLVSPDNPLTPRVTVNRIWQAYFSRGIVLTDNDFGTQGSPPTHPELLDWLAAEFVESQWDLKSLHRTIVTSAVYRQSSQQTEQLRAIDPNNELLARQSRHRLEAELIRDSALVASGLLSRRMGGPGVYPPQPEGVMQLSRHSDRQWTTSTGEDRYRRGIYTYFWRATPYPFLKAFDAPDSNASCTHRDRSNTPIAALTLLNDTVFLEIAQALTIRVLTEVEASDDARLCYAFRLCMIRDPSERELEILTRALAAERAAAESIAGEFQVPTAENLPDDIEAEEIAAWLSLSRTLLNLDEFITRE